MLVISWGSLRQIPTNGRDRSLCRSILFSVRRHGLLVSAGERRIPFASRIKEFQVSPLEMIEKDTYQYHMEKKWSLMTEGIVLTSQQPDIKLAISMDSLNRSSWERSNTPSPKHQRYASHPWKSLAKRENPPFSQTIRQEMGNLFITRSSINLHADVLDTPEFFWDHPELEKRYWCGQLPRHSTRSQVLNYRLDVIKERFRNVKQWTESPTFESSRMDYYLVDHDWSDDFGV